MHPPRTQSIQAFTQAPTTLQREARLNDFVGQGCARCGCQSSQHEVPKRSVAWSSPTPKAVCQAERRRSLRQCGFQGARPTFY
jgi:hypothetical protein